jgi:4-amino-4-deoxy-L-arabinose transferase-like glycosyltransferase
MKRKFFVTFAAILLFVAIGAYLRFNQIGLRPFWLDEANSANFLRYPLVDLWSHLAGAESAPAYVFAIKIWSILFGNSEAAIRSFSAVLSLFSIAAIYFLGKTIFGKRVGLWSAFLLAVNYFSWFYAVQARQYSAVILVSILSVYFFYQILERQKFSDLVWFLLASVLGVYLHPWFFLLFGAEFFWMLIKRRDRLLKTLISLAVIFLFSLPWLVVLTKYRSGGVNDWIARPSISALYYTLDYFTWGSGWLYLAVPILAIPFVFFRFQKIKHGDSDVWKIVERKINFSRDRYGIIFSVFFLFLLLLAAWIVSQFMPLYVTGRYEAIVLPFFLLLIGFLLSFIENRVAIVILGAVFLIFSINSIRAEQNKIADYKFDEKNVARNLAQNLQNEDVIIFTGLSRPTFDYYLPRFVDGSHVFKEYSFPVEMENHPAWQSSEILKNTNAFRDEANQLIEELSSANKKNVWLIRELQKPTADVLISILEDKFSCDIFLDLTDPVAIPSAPMHFQQILKCGPK